MSKKTEDKRVWRKQARRAMKLGMTLREFVLTAHPDNRAMAFKAWRTECGLVGSVELKGGKP